jgi:GNAT superfamily N-acetyltransferase
MARLIALDHLGSVGHQGRISQLQHGIDGGQCLVHTEKDVIDGYVIVRPGHFFGRDFVDLLLVESAARRQGIGTALLQAAIAHLRGDQIFTSTNRSNAPMQGLLASLGWQLSGELDGLDEGDPELVYYLRRQAAG